MCIVQFQLRFWNYIVQKQTIARNLVLRVINYVSRALSKNQRQGSFDQRETRQHVCVGGVQLF